MNNESPLGFLKSRRRRSNHAWNPCGYKASHFCVPITFFQSPASYGTEAIYSSTPVVTSQYAIEALIPASYQAEAGCPTTHPLAAASASIKATSGYVIRIPGIVAE